MIKKNRYKMKIMISAFEEATYLYRAFYFHAYVDDKM